MNPPGELVTAGIRVDETRTDELLGTVPGRADVSMRGTPTVA